MAAAGFVITHDTINLSTHTTNSRSRNNCPGCSGQGGRNNPRGNAYQTQEDSDNGLSTTPPPPATQPDDVVAAEKRATSRDKLPSPSTPCLSNNYFDELASDSDDDAEFSFDFADNNPKTDLSTYLTLATARCATMQLASSSLAALVRQEFTRMKIALRSDDEVECCADSGATKHMFPDYNTFISYRRVHNKVVTLGDGSLLQILGIGIAKFSINKHVILVRNALHVPRLSAPLYSLRQHRLMPGCGFFSHCDCGAFLLLPSFSIKIDDSEDCLVNFKAIGTRPLASLAYAEPHNNSHMEKARMAYVIPPEDDSDLMSKIGFHIPDPKAHPSPLNCHPPSSDQLMSHNTTPTDSYIPSAAILDASATQSLSKRIISQLHKDPDNLPEVPPTYTLGACEKRTQFDNLKLHKNFGCRKFRSPSHLFTASRNGSLINTGDLPATLGDFATLTQPARGKPIKKRRKYLDKVHLDIVLVTAYPLVVFDMHFSWLTLPPITLGSMTSLLSPAQK